MTREPLNVVILGGSFAGISVAHQFLDNIISSLSTFEEAPTYRVVLVSPSTHLYWNICAPRAIVSDELIPVESAFVEIEPGFSRYSFNVFTFMQGLATRVDTSAHTVTVELASNDNNKASKRSSALSGATDRTDSTTRSRSALPTSPTTPTDYRPTGASRTSIIQTIPYHALILATGTSANSPLYSLHGSHENTIAEIRQFHAQVQNAQSILIVGGGPPTIKELPPRPASSTTATTPSIQITPPTTSPHPRQRRTAKTITLLSGSTRLLPKLPEPVGAHASKLLARLGVHVVHSIRQVAATHNADGSANCILNNDMTITADLVIEATGVTPNTSYLPASMLDDAGYVITDPEDLRVYGPDIGARVYAVGDCASYSKNYVLDVYEAVPVLAKNLQNDLLAHEYRLEAQLSRAEPAAVVRRVERLRDARFVQNPTDSQLMPISRYGGVGVIFDVRVPSFMVHLLKGRDYKLGKAGAAVGRGRNPYETPGKR
ncbi:FAD/NAD(P)-binding domain-containing protein [Mytilinidion resinicola]|uniref:FAD/NAD(P)-binding domain-containing protein n=1 Tax=Mytilinidion resinicola TaxID=574789 RepID=A0A6A6Z7G7_9PEZI|nr:FAD/NAD(P)-binding domain-containing protein [Mytilinidion resinicola]KAF2816623.1 FAD/NAD(P)-binding domain-containing protein [Mytilinidion resinicola]